MASGAVDHSSAICITLIRHIYRRVRRCVASRYACVHAHSTGHMHLSIRILIGSIGYARWQCPAIRTREFERESSLIFRESNPITRSLPASSSSLSLSLSLSIYPPIPVYCTFPRSSPFQDASPFASRISLVMVLILPRAFSSPNVSPVARQLYLFIR